MYINQDLDHSLSHHGRFKQLAYYKAIQGNEIPRFARKDTGHWISKKIAILNTPHYPERQ